MGKNGNKSSPAILVTGRKKTRKEEGQSYFVAGEVRQKKGKTREHAPGGGCDNVQEQKNNQQLSKPTNGGKWIWGREIKRGGGECIDIIA